MNSEAWSDKVMANGRQFSSPSAKFTELWNRYPHATVEDVIAKEQGKYQGLIHFPVPESKSVVFYLQDEEWYRELWLIDNLFFLAENQRYGIATLPNVEVSQSLNELFNDEILADKNIEIMVGGDIASNVQDAVEKLTKEQKQRLSRVVYLNPPIAELSTLLSNPKAEVWSNDISLKESDNPQIIYCQDEGISFGHYFYKVFAEVLK